jgi:halimadienyl-diphosphate synthase
MSAIEKQTYVAITTLEPQISRQTQQLIDDLIADLDSKWGGGAMSAVPYDTAWVAMVRSPLEPDSLAFPESFAWLIQHQSPDGSWGAVEPHTILPTMAGLLAYLKAPSALQTPALQAATQRAEAYLRAALTRWSIAEHESVGFEVLAPRLLEELAEYGIQFIFPEIEALMKLYTEKFTIAAPQLIYTGQSNVIHSLEAFGPHLDFTAIKPLQAPNGSYGCSPAATAAVLIYAPEWDQAAADWLNHLSSKAFGGEIGGMPNAYPIDTFEASWVLYNLFWSGMERNIELPEPELAIMTDWLRESIRHDGASITRMFGMPTDSDDTGMVIAALNHAGVTTPLDTIFPFERDTHFACFARERGASISAHSHVLSALLSVPRHERNSLQPTIDKVLGYLDRVRDKAGFWSDKWHHSPYYTTACVLIALQHEYEPEMIRRWIAPVDWLLDQQSREDGGWGSQGRSSLEESAYALQVLLSAPSIVQSLFADHWEDAITRGINFIVQEVEGASYTSYPFISLWRGKELYSPPRVIWSAVLAVLHRYTAMQKEHNNSIQSI